MFGLFGRSLFFFGLLSLLLLGLLFGLFGRSLFFFGLLFGLSGLLGLFDLPFSGLFGLSFFLLLVPGVFLGLVSGDPFSRLGVLFDLCFGQSLGLLGISLGVLLDLFSGQPLGLIGILPGCLLFDFVLKSPVCWAGASLAVFFPCVSVRSPWFPFFKFHQRFFSDISVTRS